MGNIANFTSQTIYTALKEDLIHLAIKPGQVISENEICARFNVSRTPVRTAFQRLRDEGLLTIEPYKATYASLLDFDHIEQLIYMRVAVETAVLRDLIASVDAMTVEKIRYSIRRQGVLLETGGFTPQVFYDLDAKMHSIWFTFLHKDILWKTIERAQVDYTRFRMLDIVEAHRFDVIYREHLDLFDAISARDPSRIPELMHTHLYGGIRRLGERIHTDFADYFVRGRGGDS